MPNDSSDERGPDSADGQPLGKGFLDENTLKELVDAFLAEVPARVDKIKGAHRAGDRTQLEHFSHQLKGAAGLYGFVQIAKAADRVHQLVEQNQEGPEIQTAVEELVRVCQAECDRA